MDLYCLGKVPWYDSQLCYHALARLGRESLVLVSPASRYVSVGYHQDARQEIDLDFCRSQDIPVFRREVGGGVVYLDANQLFFQIVLQRDSPLAPLRREIFYRKFLQPAIEVYRRIGIPAACGPVNDIMAGTKKISGTGAGEIGDSVVFVGNLMIDFDYETMSRVLKSPDGEFRNRIKKSMKANLTTIRRELGEHEASRWSESDLEALMVQEFQKLLGPLQVREVDDMLTSRMAELRTSMTSESWLYRRGRRPNGCETKIRSGVNVFHRMRTIDGGFIRADFEIRDETYHEISLSTDLSTWPGKLIHALEFSLSGKSTGGLHVLLEKFFVDHPMKRHETSIDDWLKILSV